MNLKKAQFEQSGNWNSRSKAQHKKNRPSGGPRERFDKGDFRSTIFRQQNTDKTLLPYLVFLVLIRNSTNTCFISIYRTTHNLCQKLQLVQNLTISIQKARQFNRPFSHPFLGVDCHFGAYFPFFL